MGEIGREAIADVDHCGRQLFFTEHQTPTDTRVGAELTQEKGIDGGFFRVLTCAWPTRRRRWF